MSASIIYRVIKHFDKKYNSKDMCVFYQVSRSDYYSWKSRDVTSEKDTALVDLINECHFCHKRRYGYRRVKLWLEREKGIIVNHKRILRVMNKYNLLSVIRRKKYI